MSELATAVRAEATVFATALAGTPWTAEVQAVLDRLDEPVRLAIAGRVKAGKSTLLNALIGERLAATDAGECTRVPTWYRHGESYRVMAIPRDGQPVELRFTRDDGALQIDLGELPVDRIERIDVEWPTSALDDVVLIDTPGLASLDDDASIRTRELLGLDHRHPSQADAVVYCLRHLHRTDAEYLGAFMDRSVAGASAANAIAVLTRSDEIGAARPDALTSAARVATRIAADPRVRTLCSAVVPVAGLLGEAGRSLREHEAATVRDLAALPNATLAGLLVSVDRFTAVDGCPVPAELRRDLLGRLGLFGVRSAVEIARTAAAEGTERMPAARLASALVARSGLAGVVKALQTYFVPQTDALKARSAVVGLQAVAQGVRAEDPALGDRLIARIEQLSAASSELLSVRLRYLLSSGEVRMTEAELDQGRLLVQPKDPYARLGLPHTADTDEMTARAGRLVEHWRGRSGGGLLDPITAEVVDGLVRVAEGLYQELAVAGAAVGRADARSTNGEEGAGHGAV